MPYRLITVSNVRIILIHWFLNSIQHVMQLGLCYPNSNLKILSFTHVHSIIKYWMILGVNHLTEKDTYYTKQNTVRNMFIARSTYSPYRSIHVSTYFHQFTVNKQEKLQTNLSVYSTNPRNKCHLYRALANLSCSQNILC